MEWVKSGSTGAKSNIFVDKAKIASIKIKYGVKEDWQTYSDDISIHLTLDIGKDFQPNMYIGGNYKKDEVSGEIVGWSTAFKVKLFFDALGMPIKLDKGMNPSSSRLPADAEKMLEGKIFNRLTYLSTKTKRDGGALWKDWQETRSASYDHNRFKNEFKEAVNKGYVKDFAKADTEETDASGPWDNDEFQGMPT